MSDVIYLIRHGQTQFNVEQRAQGWCDSPLTREGVLQAEKLKRWFELNGIGFTSAYSSDLGRAVATMQKVALPEARLYQVPGLREVSFGDLDGKSRAMLEMYDHEYRVEHLHAEPYEDALIRALQSLYWIAANEPDSQTLAVSHSAIMVGLYQILEKADHLPEEIEMPNGTILKLVVDQNHLKIEDVFYV